MKMTCKLALAALLCLCCTGIATGAPTFDIDIYGANTGFEQGVYDTNTNLNLAQDTTYSVDILVSGLEEGNGLIGFMLLLEHGSGFDADNLTLNTDTWIPTPNRPNDELTDHLTIDAFADPNIGVDGDDILMFSFDLTVLDGTSSSILELRDMDKGQGSSNLELVDGEVLDGMLPIELATINSSSPVPVPAAVWLLGSGLTGLLAVRRRQNKK